MKWLCVIGIILGGYGGFCGGQQYQKYASREHIIELGCGAYDSRTGAYIDVKSIPPVDPMALELPVPQHKPKK
jgi:hypothetical protein